MFYVLFSELCCLSELSAHNELPENNYFDFFGNALISISSVSKPDHLILPGGVPPLIDLICVCFLVPGIEPTRLPYRCLCR